MTNANVDEGAESVDQPTHESRIQKLEDIVLGELAGPVRTLVHTSERLLGRIEERLKAIDMTMQSLEELISQINEAVTTVSTEVNDLISKLQAADAGGISQADAQQLAADLQASLAKIQAITPEPQ